MLITFTLRYIGYCATTGRIDGWLTEVTVPQRPLDSQTRGKHNRLENERRGGHKPHIRSSNSSEDLSTKGEGGGGIVSVIAHRGTGFPCFDVSSSINHTHQSMSKIKQKRGENKVSHRPYLLAFDTAHDVRVE